MKNKLLITTALVALVSASNVYAEVLPEDATDLSSGTYEVDATNQTVNHGPLNLSGDATLSVTGEMTRDEDGILQGKSFFNVNDKMTLSGESKFNLTETISNLNLTVSENATATIKDTALVGTMKVEGGTVNLDGTAAVLDDFSVSGGVVNSYNDTPLNTANATISGGTINLKGTSLNALTGEVNMTDGIINMDDGSEDPDLTLWAANAINISGGTINMNGNNASIDTFYDWLGDEGLPLEKPENPGDVNITGGTINVNSKSAEISSEGNINVSGNGVINVASGASLSSYSSYSIVDSDLVLGDKATINLTDTGTINLAGNLSANVKGDGNLNVKSSNALVNGDVSGSKLSFEADHSLNKAISGTISDLASLNVNKGTLTYDKQTGKIGDLNVAGGLDIGTNTVNATNVDFADKSNLALRVASTDSFGNINADSIKIGTDTTMKVTLDNGVVANGKDATFKFLNGGNVEGSFTNKIAENSRYDIAWNDDGSLKITGTATASDVVADAGGSANNAQTAEAWDSVTSSANASAGAKAVASILGDLSQNATTAAGQKAYVDALTAVAPEVAPAVQQTSTETANQVFGAVGTRLTGGSVSTGGEGMSSGDSIFKRGAMWVQGMFNKSKLDDTSKAKGFDADSNGVAFGVEKYINDDVKAGIGYAYTKTDIDGFMRSTDVDTHTAIVYGEYKPSNWYVNGIATYGWSDYSEDKNVAGVGVKADYDVETFGLQAMTGYDMQVKGFGFTPEAGLRYVHIKQDAYKDSADQRVSANDSDILTGVIGAKVSKNFELSNGMNIKPEARIAATYDLMNDDVNSVVTLANGSAYSVDGEALDRFGMEFGAGVTAEVNDNVELSLGYEGKFREDYQDHTGLLNAKYKF